MHAVPPIALVQSFITTKNHTRIYVWNHFLNCFNPDLVVSIILCVLVLVVMRFNWVDFRVNYCIILCLLSATSDHVVCLSTIIVTLITLQYTVTYCYEIVKNMCKHRYTGTYIFICVCVCVCSSIWTVVLLHGLSSCHGG